MDNHSTAAYSSYAVRPSTVLTTGVVSGVVIGASADSFNLFYNNQIFILTDFTIGSLTSVTITVEFSMDNTNWYGETYEDVAAATGIATVRPKTHVIAATGKRYLPGITMVAPYVRISAQGTGTVTGSLLKVDAIVAKI